MGLFSMLFNENIEFLSTFLTIFYVIGSEFFSCYSVVIHISLTSGKFPMIFNGKLAFLQFFVNFPCYSMGILGLRSFQGGWTDVWMYGNSPLCPTGHWPFRAAALKRGGAVNRFEVAKVSKLTYSK